VDLPRGRALFSFGDRDGVGEEVRLQHALGIACHAGTLFVADTYNNKIKTIDRATRTTRTLSGSGKAGRRDEPAEFDEPAGVSYAAGRVFVADTNNHLIRTIDTTAPHKVQTLTLAGLTPPRPILLAPQDDFENAIEQLVPAATRSAPDRNLQIKLKLVFPKGWKTNPLGPMKYQIEKSGDAGPINPTVFNRVTEVPAEQRQQELTVVVPLLSDRGKADLRISLAYFYCQQSSGICKAGTVTWKLPVTLKPGGPKGEVVLEHVAP